MVIERDKHYRLNAAVLICLLICILLLYVYGCNISLGFALLINSPALVVLLLGLIASGRTFIMDENGCTVCFLKYRRKYTWGELETRKIEEHTCPSIFRGRYQCPYLKEVIFAPYKIHKPKAIRSATYSLIHPLSCIYINFALENESYTMGRYYEVQEGIFRQKMKQWGIDLDE